MAFRHTIEFMYKIAAERSGKCLSLSYCGSKHKLEWQCEIGHKWWSEPRCVVAGQWCPKCAVLSRRLTIEQMRLIAAKRSGKCLSENYTSCKTKLTWQCKCGFIWRSTPQNIINGTWCPRCANKQDVIYKNGYKKRKYTTSDIRRIAREHNFTLLTENADCISKKYLFQCDNGHKFVIKPSNIQNRSQGCYRCNRRIMEEQCRFILEEITNLKFSPNRKVVKGKELDGYNSSLGLAFEYHGEQHYRFIKHWHRSIAGFERQANRDRELRLECQKQGIKLIEIPYFYASNRKQLVEYIVLKFKELNFSVVKTGVDWSQFKGKPSGLAKVRSICKQKNISCLSSVYLNARTKMKFKCNACDREWETMPDVIRKHGCKHCSLVENWKTRAQ